MNRYKLVPDGRSGPDTEQLEHDEHGDWVRFEDVEPILGAAADGINAAFLRDALHYWLKRIPLATLREDERDQFDKDQRMLYLARSLPHDVAWQAQAIDAARWLLRDDVAWQPINSAPKDGRPVRLKWQGTTVEATGRWDQTPGRWTQTWRDVEGDDVLVSPSHWKPV